MLDWALIFKRKEGRAAKQKPGRRPHRMKRASKKTGSQAIPSCDGSAKRSHAENERTVSSSLGTNHLGRYAHESKMPDWLTRKLIKGGQICTDGVIPDLIWLAQRSRTVKYAYFCNPCVQHVSKLRHEGGFCGYRNIQSLVSYVISTRSSGFEAFGSDLPSIFQIQDLIEKAWDMGFNANGRVETGGIRGSRKFIGTPEAHALFNSLSIPCSVNAFRRTTKGTSYQELMAAIETYFEQACCADSDATIRATDLPPIYLQHQGHSLTVVGFERNHKNECHLYVFDPSSRDPQVIKKYSRTSRRKSDASKIDSIIQIYRRGKGYLSKYDDFELLFLQKGQFVTA